jgi:hypothetical protein
MSIAWVDVEGDLAARGSELRLWSQLRPLRSAVPDAGVEVRLGRVSDIGPTAMVVLAALVIEKRRQGVDVQVRMPVESGEAASALSFSGFDALICGGAPVDESDPANLWAGIRRVEVAHVGDDAPILRLLRSLGAVSVEFEHAMGLAIRECVQNVEDHAQSRIGAVLCGRYLPDERKMRVALADLGLGIGTTLRARHPEIPDDAAAMKRVMYGGISAQSRPNNLGQGLDNLRSVVTETMYGRLVIISGAAMATVNGPFEPGVQTVDDPFTGTLIAFTLPFERN